MKACPQKDFYSRAHSIVIHNSEKVQSVMEKAVAPHSSTLAWKIPWAEEPGGLQSTGSRRVGHDWATSLWIFTFMHWRRKWQPTPVLLPGESQGRGSLVGCRLWGRTESDTTEATQQQQQQSVKLLSPSDQINKCYTCTTLWVKETNHWYTQQSE